MSIWDESEVDWTTGDAFRAAQLFERAYSDQREARGLANEMGIPWPLNAPELRHIELWVMLLTTAARTGRQLDLAAELLGDMSRMVFWTPLQQLLGNHVGAANTVRVSKRGLPRSTTAAAAVIASLDLASTVEALLPPMGEGRLESINDPGAGMLPLEALIETFLNARRRVALVRRGHAAVGTGFLVGPDLLLTAGHVVRPDGEPRPKDIEGLDVVLDFYNQGRTIAETGSAVPVTELLRSSPATNEELSSKLLESWDAPDHQLDYALLRLGRCVGDDPTPDTIKRGWYVLEADEPDTTRSTFVSVYHFPLGSYLTWSQMLGTFTFNPAGTKTRMRYRTNTLPGSSGAPIVDERGRLIGVHHYGDRTQNQAVPIWRVAAAAKDILARVLPRPFVSVPLPTPGTQDAMKLSEVLQIGPRPLVNRSPLRGKLWSAMTRDDTARSLVIVGATESGISWSWWLLSHIASRALLVEQVRARSPDGVHAILIDLRKDIAKPAAGRRAAMIRTVSRRIAKEVPDEWVSQAARQVSDFKDWCYQQLVGSSRQWWIFVDSIDEKGDVDQNGVGEILAALVDLADDPQLNLRLVLAGRQADMLSHGSLQWAEKDSPVGLTREEVGSWLLARAVETGGNPRPDLVESFLDRWFGTSSKAMRPVELALALPAAVQEVSA